jgi:hypothetical protein
VDGVHHAHRYPDCSGAVFRRSIHRFTGWFGLLRRATMGHMENDILIAGLMVLGSIASLAAIITVVARAVREEPRQVKAPETAPVLRPVSGW